MVSNLVEIAAKLAIDLHIDLTAARKPSRLEHLAHVVSVLNARWLDATEYERAAAWLHDAFDEKAVKVDTLSAAGIPRLCVEIIEGLKRPRGLTELQHIAALAMTGSRGSIRVKWADRQALATQKVRSVKDPPDIERFEIGQRMLLIGSEREGQRSEAAERTISDLLKYSDGP